MSKTRRGVEIGRVGTFPLSTGEHTFTKEHLASAVHNALTGTAPVIGIGHVDPRWKDVDASADGEPALGRVENLKLAEDGELLVGDFVDMPDWFADALPTLFPRRSLEGTYKNGNLTITAVKMLGTKMPGIHTLEDLKQLVSDEGPALIAAGADNDGRDITVVLASQPEVSTVGKVNQKLLRQALGLPEDATGEQVIAKARAAGFVIPTSDERKQEATKVIAAAAAEGKFSEARVPFWRERYERDPEGTRATLGQLVALDPALRGRISAAAKHQAAAPPSRSDELHQATRVALGLEQPVPRPDRVRLLGRPAPKPVAASAPAKPALTTTKHGSIRYGGVPTKLSDRGTRQVFYGGGWLDIPEFEAMGKTPKDSALYIHTILQVGQSEALKALRDGLPPGTPLGVV
jgi:hypothetical protein